MLDMNFLPPTLKNNFGKHDEAISILSNFSRHALNCSESLNAACDWHFDLTDIEQSFQDVALSFAQAPRLIIQDRNVSFPIVTLFLSSESIEIGDYPMQRYCVSAKPVFLIRCDKVAWAFALLSKG